jgi:hypothetical protein
VRTYLILIVLLLGAALSATLPAERVVAPAASALLQKVEAQRGQALAPGQRQQFTQATADLRAATLPAQEGFVRALAQTFRLDQSVVQAMVPATDADHVGLRLNVVSTIEARLGRPVTPVELQQIRAADNAKKAEISEIQSRYAGELARIAGLSKEQIQRILLSTGI